MGSVISSESVLTKLNFVGKTVVAIFFVFNGTDELVFGCVDGTVDASVLEPAANRSELKHNKQIYYKLFTN
mgnify:CR=1 FL=1